MMREKFDVYVLWPLAHRVQNWIVDQSIDRDFTVYMKELDSVFFKAYMEIILNALRFMISWKIALASSIAAWEVFLPDFLLL